MEDNKPDTKSDVNQTEPNVPPEMQQTAEEYPPLSEDLSEAEIFDLSEESEEEEEDSQEFKVLKRKSSRTERIPIDVFLPKEQDSDGLSVESVTETNVSQKSSKSKIFVDDIHKKIAFTVVRELFVRPNKYKSSSTRIIKMTADVQRPFVIIDNGIDYTPKRTIDATDPGWVSNPMLLHYPTGSFSEIKPDDFIVRDKTHSELNVNSSSYRLDPHVESSISGTDFDDVKSYEAPLVFPLIFPKPEKVDIMHVVFKLTETDTFILLSIASKASDINEEEGGIIKKANALHETVSTRLRKKMDTYCQTSKDSRKRIKETQLVFNPQSNKHTFSSNWDIYDTLDQSNEKLKTPSHETVQLVGKVDKIKYAESESICQPLVGNNIFISDRINWFKTGMIMERILLSNNAMKRQLLFHDNMRSDPLTSNIQFNYNLNRLWTLKYVNTEGMAVTSMSWNLQEHNILAVGYGKYNFTDPDCGAVCIWNNKNLAHPERYYHFQHSVTSLKFCRCSPNILAIAFYTGWVILVNIVIEEGVKIIAKNMPLIKTSVSPVWEIAWKKRLYSKHEYIVECTGDGQVHEYTKKHLYEKKTIMKLSKMKGKVKGIDHPKKCQPYIIPLVRNPAILCITVHPDDINFYYLGTDEGGLYKCSLQDVHQYLEMFLAHNGPVYTIQFHPACSKIFLTCGADWCIRIWGDGITTPLLTMSSGTTAVQCANWCPNQPTIIVGITDKKIELWDISRKVPSPQAIYENPKGVKNTCVIFSRNGDNLCVGDKVGNIHIYALSNMPFTPTNPDMVIALILIKVLTPNRKLLNELYKLGPPFNVSRIYKNYLNLS